MYRIYLLFAGMLIISGCERSGLSPVEIKIDDDTGYTSIDNTNLGATHIITNDETLFDVAYKYSIDPMNLAKTNGIKAPFEVRNGQVLKLPAETPPAEGTAPQREEQPKEKLKNKLDDEFEGVMATKTSSDKHMGTSFNEQADALSVPKVTRTAAGVPTKASPKVVQKAAPLKSGKMIYPVEGKVISRFGDVKDGIANDGINFQVPLGTKVKAAMDGNVIYAGNKLEEEFGNVVIVQHENGLITSYAHLDKINIKNGARVHTGDVLGAAGKTGDVSVPQLHFEVMKDKKPVNPVKYLQK